MQTDLLSDADSVTGYAALLAIYGVECSSLWIAFIHLLADPTDKASGSSGSVILYLG